MSAADSAASGGPPGPDITIRVNGQDLPLNPFVMGLFAETLKGMISALKVPEPPRHVEIHLKYMTDRRT